MLQQPFVPVEFPHCQSCTDPLLAVLDRHQTRSTDRRSSPNTRVLAPSPVSSRGIQHPGEQTDREEQRKSQLGFGLAVKPLSGLPLPGGRLCRLQPCLLLLNALGGVRMCATL